MWVLSHWFFATPWTVAQQAPLSMGFSTQEYWSGLPFPPPADLPKPGIKPTSPALAGRFFTIAPSGKTDLSSSITITNAPTLQPINSASKN